MPLALAACFSGEATRGLPCTSDESCGAGLRCVEGVCGGTPPGPSYLQGAAILFIVDNAASAEFLQDRLAEASEPFFHVLGNTSAYRVAVVTSDLGGPRCDGPGDRAAFVAEGCRDDGARTTATCEALCPETFAGSPLRPSVIPTGGAAPRPWLQGGLNEFDNVPPELDATASDIFACLVLQDRKGCPFGQPLEAARRAIARGLDPADPAYGFVRARELLALVFVTGGVECSHPDVAAAAFDPAGDRVFWGDPAASEPSPAVCWNAGVACSNAQDGEYYECHPVDRALDGSFTDDPDDAVMTPVDAFVAEVQATVVDALHGEVMVAAFTGVPAWFSGDPATLRYPVPTDLERATHGIGATCVAGELRALPPVRLREFAAAFERDLLFDSACDSDWRQDMDALARAIATRLSTPLE